MDDNGVQELSKCIDKIEVLFLDECNVTDEGVAALAEQIEKGNGSVNKKLRYFTVHKLFIYSFIFSKIKQK